MYKILEKLVNQTILEEIRIPIDKINSADGEFITINDIFVGVKGGEYVAFDRVCDHNGGQLIMNSNNLSATCPVHKWTLKLSSGLYENGCSKKALLTRIESKDLIIIKPKARFPDILSNNLTQSDIKFNFNAHASVSIEIDDISIISDPWLIGSCFANGWWHAFPPSNESIERLISSDFVYISHNHPDHLHIPTLEAYVEKTKPILVPNFHSKSVENVLRKNGFLNLIICDFMQEIQINTENGGFKIIIVKSGDDRDDSAILICTENKKVFLGVDANMPNRWVLPKVDVLFTQFAGGASGFPVRIENFNLERKIEIINANRSSVLNNHVAKLVGATLPDYVIPYAGYFTEIDRDNDVKVINTKNSPQDCISFVEEKFPNIKGINPIDHTCFRLGAEGLTCEESSETPAYFVDEEYISSVIADGLKRGGELTFEDFVLVGNRFLSSTFVDNLTIVLIPTDNSITKDVGFALIIDFSPQHRKAEVIYLNGQTDSDLISIINVNSNNLEILRVRSESLAQVIRGGLPLEDLSIGFQIKMFRNPNIYNFNFWDHFTTKEFIGI